MITTILWLLSLVFIICIYYYTQLLNLFATSKSDLLFEAGSSIYNHYIYLDRIYRGFEMFMIISTSQDNVTHEQYRSSFINSFKFNNNYHTLGSIGVSAAYDYNTKSIKVDSSGTIFNNSNCRYYLYGIY